MATLTQTTMLFVQKMLIQCEQCNGFYGAALSSPDGLILASYGQLSGDEAAACASSLIVESSRSLRMLDEDSSDTQAMLVWSKQKLFSIRKLKDESILLIASTDLGGSNILGTTQHIATRLEQALNMLGA
ncbi:MAG: hypothetical protein E6Q25_05065 [Acinetobacter sp.]|jgi:predicted regulator of Ras-like GTPase activity (Roadblock/LC7/MglB family)|nr:MAG: hypothetical protein E6Q25_05065 [Acinetobacter sp.]